MTNKQDAATRYINEHYIAYDLLRYDLLSDAIQICAPKGGARLDKDGHVPSSQLIWRDLTKQDINSIVCDCARDTQVSVSAREILTALQSNNVPAVHPLRDYLDNLPPYLPGMPDFIDILASQVHIAPHEADTDQTFLDWHVCFRKWFVAMVASWMYDEVVNHHVLVLIGAQGICKTTWLEHLLPPELRRYGSKMSAHDLGKDERLRVVENGLVNMDEIDSLNPRELNSIKSLITTADVNERAAYAYTKQRRIRIASFCASGNRRDFLTDTTGNRRWLPFEVESIDNPFFTTIDYEHTYAQALYLLQQNFCYWFDLADIQSIEAHNEAYRDCASEEELLPVFFDIPATDAQHASFMTTAEISQRLVADGNIRHPMALSRLGVVLGKAGYTAVRAGCPRRRGWLVYERKPAEIEENKHRLAKLFSA